ncbi:PsiF family protein [Paraburkholderia hospita]|uniref:PsiF family protein n=1 Tax=Paraburkholderia hospita TaxID=169430 RepID=UPI000B349538|nr:PsiF family protein [Paraburkholderia hospita]OUL89459.1 phosphate starvation-inducible protein PsiF [Paraburkholderia hospita]
MKIQAALAALALTGLLASPAFAANSQQSKMTDCNKQAGDKKGDERKAFMQSCLSAKPASAAAASASASGPMTQQDKMKMCNKQAADKKGDDRKAFMSTCLSNKG